MWKKTSKFLLFPSVFSKIQSNKEAPKELPLNPHSKNIEVNAAYDHLQTKKTNPTKGNPKKFQFLHKIIAQRPYFSFLRWTNCDLFKQIGFWHRPIWRPGPRRRQRMQIIQWRRRTSRKARWFFVFARERGNSPRLGPSYRRKGESWRVNSAESRDKWGGF